MRLRRAIYLLPLAVPLLLSSLAEAKSGWSRAGNLVAGVDSGNAFALSDGRVVSVGIPSVIPWWPATTQIWNPATNKWTKPASMPLLPNLFRAVPILLDDGRILVTGFCTSSCGSGSNTEIYDPATDTWAAPGQMATGRFGHMAVKLLDGRVLVMGGCSAYACGSDTASAEIFDPKTNTFAPAASMKAHRASFGATLLADGHILVTGGYNSTGVMTENETYDPAADKWTVNPSMNHPHALHVALLLQDGRVLVAGGDTGLGLPGAEADLFDPVAGTWKAVGSMAERREYFQGATLPNGKAIVVGGYSINGEMFVSLATCERFNPATNKFVPAKSMKNERTEFSITTLPDGRIMAVGGDAYLNGEFKVPGNAELFTP